MEKEAGQLTMRPTGWVEDLTPSKRGNAFNFDLPVTGDGEQAIVLVRVHGKQARVVTLLVKADEDVTSDWFYKSSLMPALWQLAQPPDAGSGD